MHLKITSAKWCPFCLGLYVKTDSPIVEEQLQTNVLIDTWGAVLRILRLNVGGVLNDMYCSNGVNKVVNLTSIWEYSNYKKSYTFHCMKLLYFVEDFT